MAIFDNLPGVEVAVTVNGNDLMEYRDDELDEDDRTTTRYLEATSGQNFAIRVKVPQGFEFVANTLAFSMYVDGKWARTVLVSDGKCRRRDCTSITHGVQVSENQLRRFGFASLETVSDDRMLQSQGARVKGLGTITIKVKQKRKHGRKDGYWHGNGVENVGQVPEKALKGQAISHSVSLADPEYCKASNSSYADEIPGYKDPVATFKFKYRSIESLKIEGIIPRTPTPPPLEDHDPSTLTADELRELQRRARSFREEQDSKIKIKRELHDEGPRRRKVARPSAGSAQLELDDEGRVRQSSTPTVIAEPEVIDLT